jgi:hypothetical protein
MLRKHASALLVLLFVVFTSVSYGQKYKVLVKTSEADAQIYVNEKPVGAHGQAEIVIMKNTCVEVKIEKRGFITAYRTYCNKKKYKKPPKEDYIPLKIDEAYTASISTEIVNKDVALRVDKEYDESKAWRLVTQVITKYFDVIMISDKETGYLRTAWELSKFEGNTVRTRVILTLGNPDPLEYNVKIVSEASGEPETNVSADDKFKVWDRLLKKYENIIPDIQSRLKTY